MASTTYTLNSKTINNVLVHSTPLSATDLIKLNSNPQLMGKLALETTGATKTIPELDMVMDAGASADSYYMCSEKSGAYLVDSRVAYGASVSTVPISVVNGDETTTYTKLSDTDFNLAVTIAGTNTLRPAMLMMPQTSGFFVISFDLIINSGNISQVKTYDDNANKAFSISSGSNAFIVKKTNVPADPYIYFDGTSTFDISVTNYATREATAQEIANYGETIRTNADLQQKGIQTRAFVRDGAGVPISFTSNILNYDSASYDDTQWNPSLESAFWLEEVIDGVAYQHKYDGTNLTTYTDNVVGTPALHTPENANYLLGKGVYPKVTVDPLTSYQSKTFQLYTGILYTSYDQTARYAILSAL